MRPFMIAYIPGVILYSSQGFIFSYINALFINKLITAILNANSGVSANGSGIMLAVVFYLGLSLFAMLIVAAGVYCFAISEAKATRNLKASLFRIFIANSIEKAAATHSGEDIAAINTDATLASGIYGNSLSPFLSCVISILMSSIIVFFIDVRLGLASVVLGALLAFLQFRFAGPLAKINKRQLEVNANQFKIISNMLSGNLTIRSFNLQKSQEEIFEHENAELRNILFKQAFISLWQDLFTTVQGWFTLCIVFVLGGWLVASNQLDFASLMMAPLMCLAIADGMSGIGSAWANLQQPIAAAERIFVILDDSSDVDDSKKSPPTSTTWDGHYQLRLNKLNFRYNNAEQYALQDIDITIGENEMIAFVGESGSGKSTLLRAIIGMYKRDDLLMSVGNMAFDCNDMVSWRNKFAYVDQSCKLFDLSIEENIALGAGNSARENEIKFAAARAFADEFIESFPNGYKTPCGEKGLSLSGGQKQRIAIARALIKKSPVLVFDEATSALDMESEKNIMATIAGLRKDHTILITTHNLNNVVDADRVVVMDNGKAIGMGSHKELIKSNDVYRALFTQSKNSAMSS
jgi:ABC-type multidrug transport system fused ATPase/permease subunit